MVSSSVAPWMVFTWPSERRPRVPLVFLTASFLVARALGAPLLGLLGDAGRACRDDSEGGGGEGEAAVPECDRRQ